MHVLVFDGNPIVCSERFELLVAELAQYSPEDQAKMSIASVEVLE